MAATIKHIVHRQIAEVGFYNKEGTQQLFGEISALFNTHFPEAANRVFDRMAPAGTVIRIEQLALDLGSFSYPINPTELIEKYEQVLEQALSERIEKIKKSGSLTTETQADEVLSADQTTLLQYFLLKGAIPWWAMNETRFDPTQVFLSLLTRGNSALKAMVLKTGVNNHVRKRWVYQFTNQAIRAVVTLTDPSHAPFILTYHKSVAAFQQQSQLIKTEVVSFEHSLWYFILTYLWVEMGSRFQQKMFVKSTLSQMAAHFNLSYAQILWIFAHTAEHPHIFRINHTLPSLILELKKEMEQSQSLPTPGWPEPGRDADGNDDEPETPLLHYLFYGSLPYPYQHLSTWHLETMWTGMMEHRPEALRLLLLKQGGTEPVVQRLTLFLPETQLARLIAFTEPVEADFVVGYHAAVLRQQKKKNLVKAEEREFGKSLWQFILGYMLNDHGSLFSKKNFVEYNIRQMARHYNLHYTELLLFLAQSFGEEITGSGASDSLFFLLTRLLNEQSPQQIDPTQTASQNIISPAHTSHTPTYTRDVLLFWLIHGYRPWWALPAMMTSPEEQLQRYVHSDPEGAKLLLRLALQQGIAPGLLRSGKYPLLQALSPLQVVDNRLLEKILNEITHPIHTSLPSTSASYSIPAGYLAPMAGWLTLSPEEQLAEAITLIEYFLQYNRFPQHLPEGMVEYERNLLRSLLAIVYHRNKAQLQNWFTHSHFSPVARLRLYDAVAYPADQETRNMSAMLASYAERDVLYYLQETWPKLPAANTLEEALVAVARLLRTGARKKIIRQWLTSVIMVQQVARVCNTDTFNRLLHPFTDNHTRRLLANYSYLLGLAISNPSERETMLLYFREFCFIWFCIGESRSPDSFFGEFLQFLYRQKMHDLQRLYRQLTALPARMLLLPNEQLPALLQHMQTLCAKQSEAAGQLKKELHVQAGADKKQISEATGLPATPVRTNIPGNQPIQVETLFTGEKIHLANAGLALLHPFFNTYFTRAGLVANGAFVTDEARWRAPQLLQYLVDDSESSAEHELALNKLLCGILPGDTLPLVDSLTDTEKNIGSGLLTAVTQHWEKLKNTSVQGLQSAFLQRNGTLTEADEAWNITVEPKSYDILLQTLPWGLSLIKYSWMNKPIMISWT